MCRDDADVGFDRFEHLPVVVVKRRHAIAFPKCVEFFPTAVHTCDNLAPVGLGNGIGVVVGQIPEAELVSDTAGTDQRDAVLCSHGRQLDLLISECFAKIISSCPSSFALATTVPSSAIMQDPPCWK